MYNTAEIIYAIFITILIVVLVSVVVIEAITEEITYTNKEGRCYDKNSNLINEVTCVEEIKCGIVSVIANPDRCYRGIK